MEYFKDNIYSLYYNSVLEYERSSPINKYNAQLKSKIDRYMDYGWYGPTCKNAKESIEKSIDGDEKLYSEYVKPLMQKLNCSDNFLEHVNMTEIKKRKRIKSDFGNEIHIDRIYSGQFDRAWDNTIRENVDQQRKFFTLLIDIGGQACVNAQRSLWTAASALKIYQTIISQGHNCEILVGNCSDFCALDKYKLSWAIPIKKFGEQLSIPRLCAMAYVGYYRSMGFMIKTHCSVPISDGFGSTTFYNQKTIPANLQQDVATGATRLVMIERSLDQRNAQESVKNAVELMKKL